MPLFLTEADIVSVNQANLDNAVSDLASAKAALVLDPTPSIISTST